MSFVNWLRGVKAKVDIEPVEDGNVILQDNGDGTADLFVDQGNQRLHVINSTAKQGHTIWNRIKTALTARANLWFKDANVSDASTDGATAVEVVTELQSESAFDNLATDGTADGVYVFPDSGDEYLTADMVGYGSGSVGDALDDKVSKSGDTMSGNLIVDRKDGTESAEGNSYFTLGNDTPVGTNQNSTGLIKLYSESAYPVVLYANPLTQTRYIGFPDKNGTVLMNSDLQPTLGTVTKVGVTGDLYVTMVGKIGVISGYFFNQSALTANTTIGTVPYTPLTNYVLCGTSNGAIAYIDTSGNIKIANEISSLPRGTYSIGGIFVTS